LRRDLGCRAARSHRGAGQIASDGAYRTIGGARSQQAPPPAPVRPPPWRSEGIALTDLSADGRWRHGGGPNRCKAAAPAANEPPADRR